MVKVLVPQIITYIQHIYKIQVWIFTEWVKTILKFIKERKCTKVKNNFEKQSKQLGWISLSSQKNIQ